MKTTLVSDLKSLQQFVKEEIIPLVIPKTVFLLEGDLGAGKTELIKNVAATFGLEVVQSPTFAFHHVYQSQRSNPTSSSQHPDQIDSSNENRVNRTQLINVHHVDLYRLQCEDDLESTGFWDLFQQEADVIFVEWANLIHKEAWPWDWQKIQIKIQKNKDDSRQITVTKL